MPMGLNYAPAIFMHTMNNMFSNMLDSGMVGIIDDILYVLLYSEGTLHIARTGTSPLTSVYILL